ncbi:MAG: CDP-alcohol phosphatidyltransferase, partial [Gammaproteobacteria bacterium]|nr:CDP-alcohol phosphatidyltransferase [Gammaproteobacteria bacterium]
ALGLSSYAPVLLPPGVAVAVWVIFVGYILGRLAEGAFKQWLGRFGIFCWRRIDSYSRLVTARRNPSLILLTLGALAGRPDLGLEAVALWTLFSTLFLLLRLAMAAGTRLSTGPLTSWLEEVGRDPSDRSLAARWFAGGAARPAGGRRD